MRRRLVDSYTDPATSIRYGLRGDPLDFILAQKYTHDHITDVSRELLMKNATGTLVAGFGYSLTGGLGLSIAAGLAFDAAGLAYETITDPEDQPTALVLDAADATNPRIDLVYILLEPSVQTLPVARTFRRLRTSAELAAGVEAYTPTPFTRFTEEHARATVHMRKGTPAAVPVAPALNANEVALYNVRVNANAATLVSGNVTDRRTLVRSLQDAFAQVDAINMGFDERVDERMNANTTVTPNTGLQRVYDDPTNLFTWAGVAASGAAMGMMSVAHFNLLVGATSAATANALAQRDVNGDLAARRLATERLSISTNDVSGGYIDASYFGMLNLRVMDSNSLSVLYVQAMADVNWRGLVVRANPGQNANLQEWQNGGASVKAWVDKNGNAFFAGNLDVGGSVNKASGGFVIDHPLDFFNKDLYHAWVESNEHLLVYRCKAVLVAGVAEVNLDTALGFSAGVFDALCADYDIVSVWSKGANRVDASAITISEIDDSASFTLTSTSNADTSEVWVVIMARRNDNFIKTLPNVDVDGRLVPEQLKPAPTAEELALLGAGTENVSISAPVAGTTVNHVVSELAGKQGYLRHPFAFEGEVAPSRAVTYEVVGLEDDGPNAAGAGSDDASTGTVSWSNTANITVEDATVASRQTDSSDITTHYLKASNFGLNVPLDATITGIKVEAKLRAVDVDLDANDPGITDAAVRLIKGGVIGATDRSADGNWPLALTFKNYGGVNDLWGTSWSPAQVNAADFGFALSAHIDNPDGNTVRAEVDFVRVTLYYMPAE